MTAASPAARPACCALRATFHAGTFLPAPPPAEESDAEDAAAAASPVRRDAMDRPPALNGGAVALAAALITGSGRALKERWRVCQAR